MVDYRGVFPLIYDLARQEDSQQQAWNCGLWPIPGKTRVLPHDMIDHRRSGHATIERA
jgi:hypothetical protein